MTMKLIMTRNTKW